MDFSLTSEQLILQEEIIRFAQNELNPGAAERDRTHTFPRSLWIKCGEFGMQGLPVPEEFGGSGLDALSTALAMEALGHGCDDGGLVFAIGAHLFGCVIPIWKYGTDTQKRQYLPGLCKGTIIGANAITEPDSGSDVFSMKTTAVRDGDGFRINGTKTFSSNGPQSDLVLVLAATDPGKAYHGGITAFIVEKDTVGFTVGQMFEPMGLRTCSIGEFVFEHVFVPQSSVVGGVGGGSMVFSQAMDWERICLFAAHVGSMERQLDRAIAHARTREQFGKPIGSFQAVAHSIADMKVQLEASRLLTYKAAWKLENSRNATLDASIAKLHASESLLKTSLRVVQILGGYGYMVESEAERALRDAVAGTIYSGTSEMQRNIISRWLGIGSP